MPESADERYNRLRQVVLNTMLNSIVNNGFLREGTFTLNKSTHFEVKFFEVYVIVEGWDIPNSFGFSYTISEVFGVFESEVEYA
jgi:hypothetical protein